jgi:hypothetical protein
MPAQHTGNFKPLGDGKQFVDRAEIFEKSIAFLFCFECQNGLKQMTDCAGP